MNKKIFLLLLIFAPLLFSSCDERNDDFDESQAIVGYWYGTNSNMECGFDYRGYVYNNSGGGDIDNIILNYCSATWQFDVNTHIDYTINVYNGTIQFHLYNVNPTTNSIYNEDYVTVKYYFEDYDHLVIDGAEFERYYSD